jgi:hypothetical protein
MDADIAPDADADIAAETDEDAETPAAEISTSETSTSESSTSESSTSETSTSETSTDAPGDSQGSPRALTRRYSDVSDDDRDLGWGEPPPVSGRDDEWYLRERPPHHG